MGTTYPLWSPSGTKQSIKKNKRTKGFLVLQQKVHFHCKNTKLVYSLSLLSNIIMLLDFFGKTVWLAWYKQFNIHIVGSKKSSIQDCTFYDISVTSLIHKTQYLVTQLLATFLETDRSMKQFYVQHFGYSKKQTPWCNVFPQGLQSTSQSAGSCSN